MNEQLERLSPREVEVLALIAKGYGNKSIATELHLRPSTVKGYVERILKDAGRAEPHGCRRLVLPSPRRLTGDAIPRQTAPADCIRCIWRGSKSGIETARPVSEPHGRPAA